VVSELSHDINRPGRWIGRCTIPAPLLNAGAFTVGVCVTALTPATEVAFWERDALSFRVREPFTEEAERQRCGWMGEMPGPVRPKCAWTVHPTGSDA